MRLKREYAILAAILVALSLYLILKSSNKTHYKLPKLEPLKKSEVTRLAITQADSSIVLEREDERWLIQPEGFPADKSAVDRMLGALADFTLTTLVSESGNYSQYELTDDKKISIEANAGEKVLRKLDIGKVAPTYRHTFVRLGAEPQIYQAKDNIRSVFSKDTETLRDKTALSFDRDQITGLTVRSGKDSLTLIKGAVPASVSADTSEAGGEAVPSKRFWQTLEGKPADEKAVEQVINRLANLRCDSYIPGKTKSDFENPIFSVTVRGLEEQSLSIFEKENGKYAAVSSRNDYPFLLSEWKAKQIMKKPKELVPEDQEKPKSAGADKNGPAPPYTPLTETP